MLGAGLGANIDRHPYSLNDFGVFRLTRIDTTLSS